MEAEQQTKLVNTCTDSCTVILQTEFMCVRVGHYYLHLCFVEAALITVTAVCNSCSIISQLVLQNAGLQIFTTRIRPCLLIIVGEKEKERTSTVVKCYQCKMGYHAYQCYQFFGAPTAMSLKIFLYPQIFFERSVDRDMVHFLLNLKVFCLKIS